AISDATIRSSSWEVRRAGVFALGMVALDPKKGPDGLVVRSLIEDVLGKDSCAQVRIQAIQSLGSLGAHRTSFEAQNHDVKRALESLITKNRDPGEVISAHVLLAQTVTVKPDKHIEAVLALVKKTEAGTRASALQALGSVAAAPKEALKEIDG